MDKFCVCGCQVEVNTSGYDCPRCYRHYNVRGKLIGNNQWIEFFENAERQDIKTMQYNEQEES
jgi:hypothetical protein